MQGGYEARNHDRADDAGVERLNPGNHRQTAACRWIGGEVDAKEVAPGHPHRIDKVVPGEEADQSGQTGSALRLFCQANRQADGKNQRHITEYRPAAFFNNVNNLSE